MKTLHKKHILAATMISLLSACDTDDYSPKKDDGVNTAPTHGGDIVRNFHEKDAFEFLYMLGTPTGAKSGDGVAMDLDGDVLFVENITSSDDEMVGIEVSGIRVGVRLEDIAPTLDTGDTYSVVLSYNVTDSKEAIPRTLTINVTGEDAAPESEGDLVGNFTKDAGSATLDLLMGVTDADGEELIASGLVAHEANLYDLPAVIVDNQLEIDIAAVQNDVPDGEMVSFSFDYKINDHRFEIDRTVIVNVLGVKDVPGAPLIPTYFLTDSVNETDAVISYDLIDSVVDREGDAIVVSDVAVDGDVNLSYGFSLDGTNLDFDPHAFFNDVGVGEKIDYVVTFKVADELGNVSDGERTLTITLNGEETNLVAQTGFSAGFEDASQVGPLDQVNNPGGFVWGWAGWACPEKEIRASSARTGEYGFRMSGSFCHFEVHNVIPELENDQKYAMSYWLRNEASNGDAGNPFVPLFAAGELGDLNNRFWWGGRYFDQGLNSWFEHVQLINTNESGNWDGYETFAVHFGLLKYDESYSGGQHDIDDLNMVKFGHYDTAMHDMITDDAGLFENAEEVAHTGGVVEIRDVEGANKLYVDTTGATEGVTISLPIQMGAVRTGGRYAVSLNAQLVNHDDLYEVDANTQVAYSISFSNGTESVMGNGEGITWGPNDSAADIIVTEEFGRSADVDWSSETMTLNIHLSEANAMYHIDNVRVIGIP